MISKYSIGARVIRRIAALSVVVMTFACGDKPVKAVPPAVVSGGISETQLSSVKLTADAIRRLGIETTTIDSVALTPVQTVGGEVVVPTGQSIMITAPVSGIVYASARGSIPAGGSRLSAGQPLMRLVSLPPDIARTQQDVTVAEARLRQAQLEADRVAALYKDKLVAARDQERAQADLAAALAGFNLAAAQVRSSSSNHRSDSTGLTALEIDAPHSGILRQINVAEGQAVAVGALLAEVARLDELWVRVPVYVGDLERIDRNAQVSVHGLQNATSGLTLRGVPVSAPPSADALSASVDLYYAVKGGTLVPGQRVGVSLPLRSANIRALVAPLSALVRDMSGGAWVYEQVDSLTFVRRRVDIARTAGALAVLANGPRTGTRIVTSGAAELFGTEFGAGK